MVWLFFVDCTEIRKYIIIILFFFYTENLGDTSDEEGERLHHNMEKIEKRYFGMLLV